LSRRHKIVCFPLIRVNVSVLCINTTRVVTASQSQIQQ
jgi:hypothetical protein